MADRSLDYFSTTLEKGMRILNLFDEEHSHWSQKHIAEALELNTTSTYRFINTFVEMGYLVKDEKSRQVRLGPMSIALGHRLLRAYDLRRIITPLIEETSRKYNLSIDVAIFVQNAMVMVCRCELPNTLTFHQPVSAQELYCTAIGKVFLAHLPAPDFEQALERQSFLVRTQNTISDRSQLLAHLAEVRVNGYAVNNEEYIRGLLSIGAPIFNPATGRVVGGISFDSTTVETSLPCLVDSYIHILTTLAARVTAMMPAS
ncbi:IclR family transcriptional regulator [Geopsychrobacter electrodiphilus]|uniref:IclR family transcriptional regulator n=1 Tax=Geopsychrobacter electrodiphilus TaxID=225196 RepID=UPI0003721C74|nr:IclR family transcriptional regulator [Geopsychrobacter electrodiphilus]